MRNPKIKVHYTPLQVLEQDADSNFSKSPLKPKLLLEHFVSSGLSNNFEIVEDFTPFSDLDFSLAHTEEYIEDFFNGVGRYRSNALAWSKQFAQSVRYTNASLHAAVRGAIVEPDRVHFSPTSGFHHAQPDRGGGYCTFSGQVIASLKVFREFGLSGAYLDLDGHFGNSIEDSRDFCPLLKKAIPKGFNFNPSGYDADYVKSLKKFLDKLEKAIISGKIGYVVWCHGADSHEWDDLGSQCSTKHWIECATVFWSWVKMMDKKLGRPLPIACALFGGYRNDSYESVLNLHTGDFIECLKCLLGIEIKYIIKVRPKFTYGNSRKSIQRRNGETLLEY